MNWKVEFDHNAAKEFKKLDKQSQKLISNYLKDIIASSNDPKSLGKPLRHEYAGLWRYRVHKYRVICALEENIFIILILKIARRDQVY